MDNFSEIQGPSTSKKSKLSKEVPLPIGYIDPGFCAAERVTEKEARLEHRLQKLTCCNSDAPGDKTLCSTSFERSYQWLWENLILVHKR